MFICTGDGADHCCWVDGTPCPHLEEGTVPGRRWACGLLRRLGTWDAVHASADYQETPGAHWRRIGMADCGDWIPRRGQCCRG